MSPCPCSSPWPADSRRSAATCDSSAAPGWEGRAGQGSFGRGWELRSPREASPGGVVGQQKWHQCSFFSFSRV